MLAVLEDLLLSKNFHPESETASFQEFSFTGVFMCMYV